MSDSIPQPSGHDEARLQQHCEQAAQLSAEGQYDEAIAQYNQALALMPGSQRGAQFISIQAAIADAYFFQGKKKPARETLESVLKSCGEEVPVALHFRLGQSLYDLNEFDAAALALRKAYDVAGEAIFAKENPCYREFLAARTGL